MVTEFKCHASIVNWHITNSDNKWGDPQWLPCRGFHDSLIAGLFVIVISKIYLNWVWKDESACYGFNPLNLNVARMSAFPPTKRLSQVAS